MPVPIDGKNYLKVAEAAKLADVQVQTVRRWVDSGRVEGHKDGSGRWLVSEESLKSYLRGGK